MSLTGVHDELDVAAGLVHRAGHRLGLGEGDDEVVLALEEEQLAVQAVGVVQRRPLPVDGGALGEREPRGCRGSGTRTCGCARRGR